MPQTHPPEVTEFNGVLDARKVLEQMGYAPDAIYAEGELIRVFCPIHKDQVRRSLVINARERTYKCQFSQCPARREDLLVNLYAMYTEMPIEAAIRSLKGEGGGDEEKALLEKAAASIESLRYDEALPILLKSRQINPANTITRCKLASLYLEMGDRDRGQREYLAAAEDYGVKGDLDKTLSIYNLLIILAPQDIKIRKQLAYLFSRLGRPQDAAEHLKWAVDQYLATDQPAEAASMCEQMAVLTPNEPLLHNLLADILFQQGNLDKAIAEYEAAARLLMERGETAAAKELVIKGLRLAPGHKGLAALRDKIEEAAHGGRVTPTTQADQPLGQEEQAREADFAQWIASLQEEIEKPLAERMESIQISPTDARVVMCRAQLEAIADSQLGSMEAFLRDMFQDVKRNYEQGVMSPAELRVVKEFYKAFCIAFEQIKRERGL